MDRNFGAILTVAALVILSACTGVIGSGKAATDSREVTEFTRISVSNGLEIDVQVGQAPSVVVSGDDNILPVIVTTVDGDELKVATEPNTNLVKQQPLLVTITTPTLVALSLDGGSKAKVAGEVAAALSVLASGGSEATVVGNATALTAEASGGSKLHLDELLAQDAHLIATGSSQIDARVYATAQVDASGGAQVSIMGGAKVDQNVTGGAKVIVR